MPNDSKKQSVQSSRFNKAASHFPILNFLSYLKLDLFVHLHLPPLAALGSLELNYSQIRQFPDRMQ